MGVQSEHEKTGAATWLRCSSDLDQILDAALQRLRYLVHGYRSCPIQRPCALLIVLYDSDTDSRQRGKVGLTHASRLSSLF